MTFGKKYFISVCLFFFLSTLILSCADQTGGNPEHENAVALADSIRHYHGVVLEAIGEMKEIKNKLQSRLETVEKSDSAMAQVILDINQDIATAEGLSEKHRTLIEQHKDYIDQHENSALSAEKIKMYHEQINNDWRAIQKDLLEVDRFLYLAKTRADNYLSEDLGVIFYKK